MNDEFQSVVDPLIERLCKCVDRARSSSSRVSELRNEIKNEFRKAEHQLEGHPGWLYARYALVAWIDSNLIHYQPEWRESPLEAELHGGGNAYTEFFRRAEQAYREGLLDAYEVFFICFMFGFRGVYENISQVPSDLPDSETKWQEIAIRRINRLAKQKNEQLSNWHELAKPVSVDRSALSGYRSMVNNLIFLACTIVAGLIFLLLYPR